MSVELHFNNQRRDVAPGVSLFDYAESLGINVPTSCRKQGKCKECVVEVTEGMDCLSARVPAEKHLKGNFRLSCSCRIVKDAGVVRCHTMRRGEMRIERDALHLPGGNQKLKLEPAVTRDGDRILLDGEEIARSTAPIHGLAMDLGTTTVVLRLLNLETGEVIADASFENPQRFGGSDVMSRIHYDTEEGGHLLQRTLAGYLTHAIEDFPGGPEDDLRNGRGGELDHARPVLPPERLFHRPKSLSFHHRTGNGRRQADDDQPGRSGKKIVAAAASPGARLRPAHHQRPCRCRCRRVHARRGPGKRRAPDCHHGHRHQHGVDSGK